MQLHFHDFQWISRRSVMALFSGFGWPIPGKTGLGTLVGMAPLFSGGQDRNRWMNIGLAKCNKKGGKSNLPFRIPS